MPNLTLVLFMLTPILLVVAAWQAEFARRKNAADQKDDTLDNDNRPAEPGG